MSLAALRRIFIGLSRPRIRPPVTVFPSPPGPLSGASRARPLPPQLRGFSADGMVFRLFNHLFPGSAPAYAYARSARTLPPMQRVGHIGICRNGAVYRLGPMNAIRTHAARNFSSGAGHMGGGPQVVRGWAGNPLAALEHFDVQQGTNSMGMSRKIPFLEKVHPPTPKMSHADISTPASLYLASSFASASAVSEINDDVSESVSESEISESEIGEEGIYVVLSLPEGLPLGQSTEELHGHLVRQQRQSAEVAYAIEAAKVDGVEVEMVEKEVRFVFAPEVEAGEVEAWVKSIGVMGMRVVIPLRRFEFPSEAKKGFIPPEEKEAAPIPSPEQEMSDSSWVRMDLGVFGVTYGGEGAMEARHEEMLRMERVRAFIATLDVLAQEGPFCDPNM